MATGIIAKQEKALKTMGHACDLRDLKACVLLGHWYKKNLLKQPSAPDKSIKVWMRACKLGARAVCFRLGQVWHRRQRRKLACRLYRKSCLKEHAEGCLWQGWCSLDKAQTKRRSKRLRKRYLRAARRLFKTACDLRSGAGCNRYGLFYSNGALGIVDEPIARRYFGRACGLRSPFGCFNAGLYALSGRGGLPPTQQGKIVFKQACTLGDAKACYLLGTILHRVNSQKASQAAALTFFRAACRYKLAQGCYHVGYLLAREASLARTCTVAGPWIKQACSFGMRPCPRCKPRRRLPKPPPMEAPAVRWRSLSQLIEDHAP